MRPVWLMAALAGLLSGCMTSEVLLLEGSRTGGAAEVQWRGQHLLLVEAGQGLRLNDGQRLGSSLDWLTWQYRPALAVQPLEPRRFQLLLEADGRMSEAALAVYEQALATIRQRAPASVWVIGHTDTLGDARTNERVGLRRAQQVARMLEAEKLDLLRLKVGSHGERNLLIHTPDGTAEPRNRRVEVRVQ